MEVYTLGVWRVIAGKESEFVEAWKELGDRFGILPHPPGPGTLIQSVEDPQQLYSFGPWRSLDDIQEMRGNSDAAEGVARLADLCEVAKPGTFRVVARADSEMESD